ncbi:MAG: ABC transporter permease subunit, partial [Rickettsiaceae bacterium]|nr:ABC transporter permease subunit [Rickettsiaceae bacterium]
WFFIVASEVINVGNESIILDGIGSYIALSLTEENTNATLMAVVVMSLIIILYDQLIMRPLVVWSDRFVYDMSGEVGVKNTSWALNFYSRSHLCNQISIYFNGLISKIIYTRILTAPRVVNISNLNGSQNHKFKYIQFTYNILFNLLFIYIAVYISIKLVGFIDAAVDFTEVLYVLMLATITWFKIMVLVMLASIVWVPLGVYMGLNPKIAGIIQLLTQFLAAFPINLLFPFVYLVITKYNLNPNIWLSPLMIVGTQWYILFNVVGAANSISLGLRDVAKLHKIKGFVWWKEYVMPAILPYYITGAITAYGASWNASIVSEVVTYGNHKVECLGIGAYIADMTNKGDFARIALGILVMAIFVVIFNKLFWQKLYDYAAKKCNI